MSAPEVYGAALPAVLFVAGFKAMGLPWAAALGVVLICGCVGAVGAFLTALIISN